MNPIAINSIEFAELVRWLAYDKHKVWLNKTQLQKFIYISYGLYLAITDEKLFEDDRPKAWPFGPVFPRAEKRVNTSDEPEQPLFYDKYEALDSGNALKIIVNFVVETYHGYTAKALSEWSHADDGPWYQTLYPNGSSEEVKWNQVIEDDMIKAYFKDNFLKHD